jgi:[ribosomal protein S5]-alanine N-acetyltransferase
MNTNDLVVRGDRIYLRALTENDITDQYLSWFRDEVVVNFLQARNLTHVDVRDHLEQGKSTGIWHMYAVCLIQDDSHIGNVKIGPIVKNHKISDLVIVIGDRNYWGKGIGTEAIRLGTKLAFEVFHIHKLSGSIYAENLASIRSYKKAGWVEEARLRGHYLHKGKRKDLVIVSCFNPKYFQTTWNEDARQPDSDV